MPDILSQREIDTLLDALTSGEVTPDEMRRIDQGSRIRSYDFRRAMRFSKEQMRSISRIYEQFGRLLATNLGAQLRTSASVNLASVAQLPYFEFMQAIPSDNVLHVIDVSPGPGKFLIDTPQSVTLAMLDRMLGGSGEVDAGERRLTEIDMQILERLIGRTLPALENAWSAVADLRYHYDSLEVNSQFVQIATQGDVAIVVSMVLAIGPVSGVLNVCMPHTVLEPILSRLSSRYSLTTGQVKEHAFDDVLARHVDQVSVTLRAELGCASIPFRELMDLRRGDVIPLEQRLEDEVLVKIGDESKFRGQPGTRRGHLAIRITEALKDGDDIG